MSKKITETEYTAAENEGLFTPGLMDAPELSDVTEADILAADRLMKACADEEDSHVDYSAMLRNIKAEAMRQGLAAKVNEGKKNSARTKRVLRIAASVAAAFVVGLGVLGVIKAVSGQAPADNNGGRNDVSAANETPATAEPMITSAPIADATEDIRSISPDFTPQLTEQNAVEYTPLPTETAVKGGVMGYTYITGFTAPETSEGLYEGLLPDYMTVEPIEDCFGFVAFGNDEDDAFHFISCRLEEAADTDLAVGVARYTIKNFGGVSFVWRIDDDNLMYIDFEGYDYSEAEEFLFGYSIREAEATPAAA